MGVLESLELIRLAQSEEQKSVHKLSAAVVEEVGAVSSFPLVTGTKGVERKISEMLRIVVVARRKGIQPTSQTIDGGVERRVILVGENDVELAIQLGSGQFSALFGGKGEADEVGLGTVADDVLLDL